MEQSVKCDYCHSIFSRHDWELPRTKNHFCCHAHYYAWVRSHQTERFWGYVKKSKKGCWKWTGPKIFGYGVLGSGKRGLNVKAHRYSYELHHGKIPPGKYVLHKCDNPPCVNPKHLWIGNMADNMKDKVNKRRHMFGSSHYSAKLTESKVKIIRSQYQWRKYTMKRLAKEFGVKATTITSIIHRRTWKHV